MRQVETKLTGKKKFAPKLSVRTPNSRGKCGFEVKFWKKSNRKFKAISIPQNAFSGNFRGQSPIGALWGPILLRTLLVRAGGYGIFLPETKPRFVLSVRVERFEFFWLGQKGTGLFPFELEGTAVFGLEPKLTGKKKFAPKLSVRTPDSRGKCGFEVKFRKKSIANLRQFQYNRMRFLATFGANRL